MIIIWENKKNNQKTTEVDNKGILKLNNIIQCANY